MERISVSKILRRFSLLLVFLGLFFAVSGACGQEAPTEVSVCELARNPKFFDGKTLRIRGTLSVFFEDFSLVVGDCDTHQGIWLAFGGDVPGIVASMANDTDRKPGVDITVNGIPYGMKKDESFRRLYALLTRRHGRKPDYSATATLTGAFFAGRETKLPSGNTVFDGYGHLGCCSLFVITEVSDVQSVPPANLNLSGTLQGPDGRPVEGFVVFDDILGGSPPLRQQTTTNYKGEFEFSDSGQLLRFESPSFRPIALVVEPGGAPVHVKLEDAKQSDWLIPSCEQAGTPAHRVGFSVLFALPTRMKSKAYNDEEVGHSYFIYPRGGNPDAADLVISTDTDQAEESSFIYSTWSEQRWIKDKEGAVIGIDSQGRLKDGGSWRRAIFLRRDSIGYTFYRKKDAGLLDNIIDSACLAKQ
jgi:hypothetical protein